MKDSELTKLLRKCAKLAVKHKQAIYKVAEACEEMYGLSYSDVDADGLIDVLDYGNAGTNSGYNENTITSRHFHKEMKSRGAERIDKDSDEQAY